MLTSSNGNVLRVTGDLCGDSPITGEFPAQKPVTWSFHVFLDLCLNKRLRKPWWGWWFETSSRSLWRHCNVMCISKTAFLGPLIEMEVIVHKPALFVITPVPQFNIKMSSCQYRKSHYGDETVISITCQGIHGTTFQYPIRRLIVRSHEVSKPRDWWFELSLRFQIWQAHRQQCHRGACQFSM